MYDIVNSIIDHVWNTGSTEQSTIYYICASLIIILTVVIIDMVRSIFRGFIRR